MTSFNFTDVFEEAEGAGYGPSEDLAVGKYTGSIVGAGTGSSQAGDPKIWFLFKADEGSISAAGEDVAGDTIILGLTFSEKGGKYAAADAKALGINAAQLNADADAAVEATIGQTWKFKVTKAKKGDWINVNLGKRTDVSTDPAPTPSVTPGPPAAESDPTPIPAEEPSAPVVTEPAPAAPEAVNSWDI